MTNRTPFRGQMGALIRSKDWSKTKLGPIESWPRTLQGYIAMVLEMPTPAIIFWGPDQTQLYNSVATHELKTPLTPLALRLSLMKREAQGTQSGQRPRERELRNLEVAERQVKKLAELVGDLLDVSRLSTGRMKLELEPVDLSALVQEAMGGTVKAESVPGHGATFTVELPLGPVAGAP